MQCGLNELLSQRRFRVREDFADRVLLNQLTVADDGDAVTDTLHHVHFVRNKEDSQAQTTVNVFQQFRG